MYVMGVINSRRLGKSLGLDIIGADGTKRCNFNCIYCEVGNGKYETKRGVYADFDVALEELKKSYTSDVDVITFSGNGEPTLNIELGNYIDAIKEFTKTPVCVITNSTTLNDAEVVNALLKADIVMPSIDTCSVDTFKLIDRPLHVDLDIVMKSLLDFSSIYKGKLFLEILFVKGVNDSEEDILRLTEFVKLVNPTELHINTVDRTPAEKVEFYTPEEKDELANFFVGLGIEVKMY